MINSKIFQAYDIRGRYKKDFNDKDAYLIARIFADYIRQKSRKKNIKIIVDYDLRKSSRRLADAVINGLKLKGVRVFLAGISTSPHYYFNVNYAEADGGIMITASHLGKNYNGFKFVFKKAVPVDISEFYRFFKKNILSEDKTKNILEGKIIKVDFLKYYLRFLKLNNKSYQKLIHSKKIIFDFDGDRVFFKNNKGEIIRSDLIACVLVKDYLSKFKRAKIVIDRRSSKILRETIKENGGKIIFSKVGHLFFKKVMAKEKALFGVEVSGHYYFKEFFYCDNGLLAAVKFFKILDNLNCSIEEAIAPFKKYFQSNELNFKAADKFAKIKEIEKIYKKKGAKINKDDGLTVEFRNWWFNLRASNTENLLRLNLEADEPKVLMERLKEIKKKLIK